MSLSLLTKGARKMSNEKIPLMLSLKDASNVSGLSVSELRYLCITNQISFYKAGNKYLVNMARLFDFLGGGFDGEQLE